MIGRYVSERCDVGIIQYTTGWDDKPGASSVVDTLQALSSRSAAVANSIGVDVTVAVALLAR